MIRGRTTIEARALVCLALLASILFILFVLVRPVFAADAVTECSAARGDGGHWSWREIEGKRCWYRGEPGRSKSLLRWSLSSPRSSAVEGRAEISTPDLGPAPVIEPTPIKAEEEVPWQASLEDQLKASTCCWPELETPVPSSRAIVTELPRASPPVQPLWPLIFIPVTVIAVSVLLAKRRLT